MKKILHIILFSSFFYVAHAQVVTTEDNGRNSDAVMTVVQQMPKFNGDLSQYLSKNIHYPEKERKAGVMGTVYITFVVEKDGSVSCVRVLRGVPNGPGLETEAMRVVSSMPNWKPGMQNGKAVRVQFNLPINFKLM